MKYDNKYLNRFVSIVNFVVSWSRILFNSLWFNVWNIFLGRNSWLI